MNEELRITITADIDDAEKALKKASDEVEDFGRESEETSKAVDEAFQSAGDAIKSAMKVTAGAIAVGAAAIVGLAESTREYRTAQGKLITAFESAGSSAETARGVYTELNSVLGDSDVAVEAAGHLAKLTTNEQELAEWADICTGVYATFGDSLPIEGLTEAANETAKVGQVTGGLADALNWAGESEDAFNEKLAACVDEQEREKLIRETLTKVYKKASDQYKKTNKDIINSNKATENINASMAEMGKTVEPLVTEVKQFGAAILDKLQEPLEGIVDFIMDDVIPTIKKVSDWVKNNKGLVIGMVTGLTAAFVSYKVATIAAKAAEEGITIATLARAAAQKVLNAAMAATPAGLIITAIVGLTAAFTAYAIATQDSTKYTKDYAKEINDMNGAVITVTDDVAILKSEEEYLKTATEEGAAAIRGQKDATSEASEKTVIFIDKVVELTDEERALLEKAKETAEALDEQKRATEEACGEINNQMGYVTDLAEELMKLADESGKVKEADQARADFIINQLNEALGTEYEMVDGVIQKYQELKTSIYDVINAKTAQMLLDENQDDYVEAIKVQQEALDAISLSYQDYTNALAINNLKIEDNKKEIEKQEARLKEVAERGGRTILISQISEHIKSLKAENDRLQKDVDEKKATYDENTKNYATYANTINGYETAMMEMQKGNYSAVIDMYTGKTQAAQEYTGDLNESTKKNLDILYNESIKAGIAAGQTKINFENGVEGYTEEMVKEAEKAYDDAIGAFEDAYDKAYNIGEDLGEGVSNGLEDKKTSLVSKARNIVSSIWKAMRNEAQIKSPSRKTMAIGKELDRGLEYGIDKNSKEVISSAKDLVSKTILPIEGVVDDISYKNINGIFNSSALSASSSRIGGGVAADINASSLINQLINSLNSSGTPIVLQVDGKVFAETAISSINQLTKQTGTLALNIM